MANVSEPSNSDFAKAWDSYADAARAEGQEWPGDDWGSEELWNQWFERLFVPFEVATWQRAVELGQGTGKYTERVLSAGCAEVLACDVSARFLELCRQRLASYVESDRLHLKQIAERDPDALQGAVDIKGWRGSVDAVFSIDTMVHLPFTDVASYMLAATEVLCPDGLLILTFANGCSEPGMEKMVRDLRSAVQSGGDPRTGCFHWVSPELVRTAATFMGYAVELCDVDPYHLRDGHLVARFTDPERARKAAALRD